MAYLLLLACVYSFSIVILLFQDAERRRSAALSAFGLGFTFLAIGYAAQGALKIELSAEAARLFYWARLMLPLAWLGQGAMLLAFPENKWLRWAARALASASLAALLLVAFTQITNAEDWFRTENTIYAQISDLLATNRPTRWLALALNVYGSAGLIASAIYVARRTRWLPAILIAAGAAWLTAAFYVAPLQPTPAFYLAELFAPIALYAGLRALSAESESRRKR